MSRNTCLNESIHHQFVVLVTLHNDFIAYDSHNDTDAGNMLSFHMGNINDCVNTAIIVLGEGAVPVQNFARVTRDDFTYSLF